MILTMMFDDQIPNTDGGTKATGYVFRVATPVEQGHIEWENKWI